NANAMDLKDKVKFVFADASKYKEFNGINVVYMYNPFQEEVMNKVEQNLRRHAGKTLVVYNKPLYGHLFKDKGWSVLHEQNMQHNKAGKPSFDPDLQTQIFSFGFENGPNAP
ncbi:MAG: hypothetical protein KTR28_08225, partial [Micavibrio sp.]|nr:hypothetical protein [Micavibrio sp.]